MYMKIIETMLDVHKIELKQFPVEVIPYIESNIREDDIHLFSQLYKKNEIVLHDLIKKYNFITKEKEMYFSFKVILNKFNKQPCM